MRDGLGMIKPKKMGTLIFNVVEVLDFSVKHVFP
jgi:hypothetical protein